MKRFVCFGFLTLALLFSAAQGHAAVIVNVNIDEFGDGTSDLGGLHTIPSNLIADPSGGTAGTVLAYLVPGTLVEGDVNIQETVGVATLSDVIRFYPYISVAVGTATLILFYSDQDGGVDAPADGSGLPVNALTNVVTIPEVASGGNQWSDLHSHSRPTRILQSRFCIHLQHPQRRSRTRLPVLDAGRIGRAGCAETLSARVNSRSNPGAAASLEDAGLLVRPTTRLGHPPSRAGARHPPDRGTDYCWEQPRPTSALPLSADSRATLACRIPHAQPRPCLAQRSYSRTPHVRATSPSSAWPQDPSRIPGHLATPCRPSRAPGRRRWAPAFRSRDLS